MIGARQTDTNIRLPEAGRALIADAGGRAPAAVLRAGLAIALWRDAVPFLTLVASLPILGLVAYRTIFFAAKNASLRVGVEAMAERALARVTCICGGARRAVICASPAAAPA